MANLSGHFGFTGRQEQKLSKDSPDGAIAVEVCRDRRSQVSDDSTGHFPRQHVSTLGYEPVHANVALLKAELKAITNDRDILRRELSKMQSQLENHKQFGFTTLEKSLPGQNYEWLKLQCDQAMNELQSLKEQHSDTVKKCDSAMNRADLYKQQYEKAKESNAMMRSQFAEVVAERQQLETEREELQRLSEADQRQIDELRKKHQEALGQGTSFEEFSIMYDLLKQDYEALRKQYTDSVSVSGAASAKAEALQVENSRLLKQNNALYEEKKTVQQYLSQNLHNFGLEKSSLVHELTKTKQEKDAVEHRLSQVLAEKLKEMKEFSRLRTERNEVLKEYQLIMSERDTVHKEMEQMQDVITELKNKVAALMSEKSSALNEVDRLRQMLRSACDNYGNGSENTALELEQEKILHDFDEMLEITSSERDSLNPYSQNSRTEVLGPFQRDNLSKDIEILRRDLEKAQSELMDALHDLEEAKQQRDWAFGERDKIVKERESIRTLCDKLRHERDSAVSELIGALRDSDELKRQKSDVMKEFKDLKEKYEALLEKEEQKNRLSAIEYSHSRDSAIDADLQEWETETLELDIGKVHSSDLGFDLGSTNDPQCPNDSAIFVRSIQPNSAAYGKLKVSDQLLRINDIDVSSAEKAFVYQVLCNSPEPAHIVVRRKKMTSSRAVFPIRIYRAGDREVGISLEQGLYVNCLMSGSSAAKDGSLAVGDRILNINGLSLENRSASEAMRILSEAGDHVVLNVLRYCQTPTSSLVSSTSMFSGSHYDGYSDGGGFRSPHGSSWKSPTDEHNSCINGNAALKSSSSQTDGLNNSGFVEPRRGSFDRVQKSSYDSSEGPHEMNLFDKAMNVIARPFRSSRAMRDMRSKSTHPFVNAASIEAWKRQQENISECPSPQKVVDYQPPSLMTTKGKTKSHGTWPKCHMHIDYTGPSDLTCGPLRSGAERPCLSQVTRLGANALHSNQMEHKAPPLPPTRTDSIKRSASIKHSPQNSDNSSKYSSVKGSFTGTLQRFDKTTSDTFRISEANQTFVTDSRLTVASAGQLKDSSYSDSTAVNPRTVSPGSLSYSPINLGDQQIVQYTRQKADSRTVVAVHRPERRSQDSGLSSSGLWPSERLSTPQKPASLDIHPMYTSCFSQNQDGFWPSDFRFSVSTSNGQVSTGDTSQRLLLRPTPWMPKEPAEPSFQLSSASSSSNQTTSFTSNNFLGVIRPPVVYGSGLGASSNEYPGSHIMTRCSPVFPVSPSSLIPRSLGPSIPETPDLEISSSSNKDDSQTSSSPSPMRSGHQFHERIRIPSSPSIVSSRSSGGAISSPSSYDAITDYRSSAVPFTLPHRSRRHPPVTTSSSLPKMVSHEQLSRTRPHLGETRSITVEISEEPLGIRISSSGDGGIFVSSVNSDSVASKAGIEIGDQLLEVCGINMRNATKQNAARILRQCAGTIEMLVQYNPDKYREPILSDSDEPSEDDGVLFKSNDNCNSGSGTSRARASNATITPETFMTHATFGLSSKSADESSASPESRAIVRKKLHPNDSLGVELVGGNVIGIFVKNILPGSVLGGPKGIRIGDQILEFNDKDFRGMTLEQAILEISKPCDQVVCRVQYNFPLFLRTESQSGDGFYVQALYSRAATCSSELSFKRGDILFIENTVLKGRVGIWWAYLVNENGDKLKCGTIPSKTKLEEEMSHKRSLIDVSSCQASGTVRRSFFQRHRQRNGSKDSHHELSSFSDASLNSDSIHHLEDIRIPTLEKIEKFDNSMLRPVIIVGAFAEQIVKKLTSESPDKFCRYDTDMTLNNEEAALVKYRTAPEGMYKVISIKVVQQIIKQNRHCLLAAPPEIAEKLQKAHVFPIVLFIKYKSQKQIRDVKDTCFIPEKVSGKMAKDLFEQGQEYEQKYKRFFSDSIPGGNLALMCCQIKLAIDKEQKKTLWIPAYSETK